MIKELYGRFIEKALPDAAKSLGIAYTPVPVVDYVIRCCGGRAAGRVRCVCKRS